MGIFNNPRGVLALSRREIVRFLTVATQTLFPPLVSSALFMFIFGVTIGSRIQVTTWPYLTFLIPGLITMNVISSSYENTSSSLFIGRWHNHIQEVLLSPLSYFEMVAGLLAGGLARGMIVGCGVFLISLAFHPLAIQHPWLLLAFITMIAVIFACGGMLAALWAEDFNMLTLWNTYAIIPLVMLGGVFHPIEILPMRMQIITHYNPMFYLVSGVRYAITGIIQAPLWMCLTVSLTLATAVFSATVYLFRIGYKLRT